MITFITSSPTGDLDGKFCVEGIDYRNGFCENLRSVWKENSRCLIASACPDNRDNNEEFAGFFKEALHKSNLSCTKVDILDCRWMDITKEDIHSYDLIVLGGGHVPTQNAFFQAIGLREKIQDFDGIVIGISAGSMNAAEIVYAQPEEAGEAVDPNYRRYLKGLGLTWINVLPHYQMLKDSYLDGMRLFEEISCGDSHGKFFLAIPDGSYVMIKEGESKLYGPAWRVYPHGLEPIDHL